MRKGRVKHDIYIMMHIFLIKKPYPLGRGHMLSSCRCLMVSCLAILGSSFGLTMIFCYDFELVEIIFSRMKSWGGADGCLLIVLQQCARLPNEVSTHLPSGYRLIFGSSSRSLRGVGLVPVFLENTARDIPSFSRCLFGMSPTVSKVDRPPIWRRAWVRFLLKQVIEFALMYLFKLLLEFIIR